MGGQHDQARADAAGDFAGRIVTVNGGSSSLKFAVFTPADPPERIVRGQVERVGGPQSLLVVAGPQGEKREEVAVEAPDQAAAARLVIEHVLGDLRLGRVQAVGHRVVHGGPRYVKTEVVSEQMLRELRTISPFDPDHLPGELALIEAFGEAFPGVDQVACFDTAFHATLPPLARVVPIPRRYAALGVRRYGFHGLSYAYLVEELARVAPREEAQGRVVLAHLGSGASMAAVYQGRSCDTSMGFTPASGLVMGTRSGDVDPALACFLAATEGMTPERFYQMINHESGLLGVSQTSADMRELMARRSSDPRAAEAMELFCYEVKKRIGAYAAALGGLDSLVFSGGIGENVPEVRQATCAGLEFLGIRLDPARNAANGPLISSDASAIPVRVIRTDEEAMIAREVARLMRETA